MSELYPFLDYINILLYALLLTVTGFVIYWIMIVDLKLRVAHYRYRLRLKRKNINKKKDIINKSKFISHLYQLFAIHSSKADISNVYTFLFIEFFVAVSVFSVVTIQLKDGFIALISAAMAVGIPYLYLVVRARNIQNEIGSQILNVVETLIHSYSSTKEDMYAALTLTHNQLEQKAMRQVMIRLINDLQTAHDDEDLRNVVEFFIYSTGNSWGMRLGNIILKAYVYQENVNSALLTLQHQMITHRKMLEEEKAEASDVSLQAGLAVILFPVSLIGAKYITQPQNWWVLQFRDSMAFGSFVFTLLFVLIAGLIGYIVRKPKSDL